MYAYVTDKFVISPSISNFKMEIKCIAFQRIDVLKFNIIDVAVIEHSFANIIKPMQKGNMKHTHYFVLILCAFYAQAAGQ